jgi:hypothetical protein
MYFILLYRKKESLFILLKKKSRNRLASTNKRINYRNTVYTVFLLLMEHADRIPRGGGARSPESNRNPSKALRCRRVRVDIDLRCGRKEGGDTHTTGTPRLVIIIQKWSPILVGNRCCNCTCFCAAAVACSLHDDVAIPPCFFLTSKTQTIYSPRHGHVGRQRLLPGMSYSIDSSLFSSGPSGSCELDLVAVKNEMDGCLVGHRVPAGSRNIRFFIRFISIHMCLSGLVWNLVEILFQSTPTHVDWCESDYIQTRPKRLEEGRLSVSGAFSNWARGEASFYTNAPSKI